MDAIFPLLTELGVDPYLRQAFRSDPAPFLAHLPPAAEQALWAAVRGQDPGDAGCPRAAFLFDPGPDPLPDPDPPPVPA